MIVTFKRRRVMAYLSRHRGLIFLCCILIAFAQAGLFAGRRDSVLGLQAYTDADTNSSSYNNWLSFSSSPLPTSVIPEHPIHKLMADAEVDFRKRLYRQSRTLSAAVAEYKRRYQRAPPKGFDKWWQFAKQHNVKMLDEYDGLVEDLAPFWEISGKELRQRAMQAGSLPAIDLVQIRNGTAIAVNVHPGSNASAVSFRAVTLRRMMKKFQHTLPDMDFPVNARAEGRVLVPWEHRQYPNMTSQDSTHGIETMLGAGFSSDWKGTGNVWEAYRRTCPSFSAARRLYSSIHPTFTHHIADYLADSSTSPGPGAEFYFPKTTVAMSSNYCSQPWAHYTQGHFFSDYRTIPAIYPVFSPAKTNGYLDIRIPSHYYYGSTPRYTYGWDAVNLELKEVEAMEVPWEDKKDKIFWRGASTGGGSNPPGFSPEYQRHRFLRMANDDSDLTHTITFADPPGSSRFVSARVPIRSLTEDIMDVAFVKAVGAHNYPGGLQSMMYDHRFDNAVSLGEHWAYKYLVDLDGVSYSARFMGFMASDSAVLKATVYREYFSDWIQPWLHFIPLSSSYREVFNVHAFFSGPTESTLVAANSSTTLWRRPSEAGERISTDGDRRLRRIARAGKQWKKTIGRTIDMEVYVYRLCLEYARLWADDRESMNFKF